MIHLLFIDDDEDLLKINRTYFEKRGYAVWTVSNEADALSLLSRQNFDCLILDILLTKTPDGYQLCQSIKNRTAVPIIFLTSLSKQEFLYRGFSCGGDDYMTKPYDLKELELRMKARINQNRCPQSLGSPLVFPPLSIYISKRQVLIHDTQVKLTASEFDILLLLARSPEHVFTLEDIYRNVWQMPDLDSTHTVQVHIGRMRRKLEAAWPEHNFIATSWGKGYLFTPARWNG